MLKKPQVQAFLSGLSKPLFETPDDGSGMVSGGEPSQSCAEEARMQRAQPSA